MERSGSIRTRCFTRRWKGGRQPAGGARPDGGDRSGRAARQGDATRLAACLRKAKHRSPARDRPTRAGELRRLRPLHPVAARLARLPHLAARPIGREHDDRRRLDRLRPRCRLHRGGGDVRHAGGLRHLRQPASQHHHRLRSSMSGSPCKEFWSRPDPEVTGPTRKAGGFYRLAEDRAGQAQERPADRSRGRHRGGRPHGLRRGLGAGRAQRPPRATPARSRRSRNRASAATARPSTRPSSWSSGR